MKKIGIGIGVLMLMVVGCGKDELIPESSESIMGAPKLAGIHRQLWIESKEKNPWSDDDGGDITCVPPAANCFDEVVVVGMAGQPNDWDTFLSYYDQEKVDSYFNNENWKNLFPDLVSEPQALADLKDQVTTITLSRYTSRDSIVLCIAHKSGIDLSKFDARKDIIFASPIQIK